MGGRARISLFVASYLFACAVGYNIDTDFPMIFRGERDSYFGYTVALFKYSTGPLALVSAPKAYDKQGNSSDRTGALYKCAPHSRSCDQMLLERRRAPWENGAKNEYNETYYELRKDMFLGSTLDTTQTEGKEDIVVCAHLWKDARKSVYFLNGACYVVDHTLHTTQKLLPLNQLKYQVISVSGNNYNYYIHGMAGFSAAYTEDGRHLLLGAPGFSDGIGSVIDYTMGPYSQTTNRYILRPEQVIEEKLEHDCYIGYSVTSGKFFTNAEISYVAGAPRAENDIGCVYIFEQFSSHSNPIILEKLIGEQTGEYYGYAVLGVDINGDSYTDLLVGAPFHSKSDTNFDTGRVYVYISDGTILEKQSENLEGPKKQNARFGTAISNAGDLNMDGYIDIAVGAPYEDGSGAVYIYQGTTDGINPKYVQRIVPSQLKVDLTGFGFSISRAKDIDSNGYADLLIGAYSSDSAVLLRSHPVIVVQARIDFNTKHIRVNSSECEIDGVRESCFTVTYCMKYSGKHVPARVDMTVNLQTDMQKYISPRTYLVEETSLERKSEIETEVTLYIDKDNCYMQKVYIKRNVEDFITPLPFLLTYDVKNSSTQQFCKECPTLDKDKVNSVRQEVMFWTGCGDDNECSSDLKLQVSLENEAIVIGEKKPMIVEITTENEGEHAYQSVVHVCMQYEVNIINIGECSIVNYIPTNFCLKCSVGNPLKSLDSKSLQLKLDPSNLPGDLTQFEFYVVVNTSSKEIHPSNNNITVTVPIISKAGVQLIGSSSSEVVYLEPKNLTGEPILIKHKYTVAKLMPSPITSVNVILLVPVKLDAEQPFFEISNLAVDQSMSTGLNVHCGDGDMNDALQFKENVVATSDHNHNGFNTVMVSCKTAICHVFRCAVGPFLNKEAISFEILGFMNITSLQEAVGKQADITIFATEGIATIGDENVLHNSSKKTDYTSVTTSFERKGLHKTKKIPWWIIIVSVIAGILLLVILIVVLIKVGFFRRKEKEEMDSMKEDPLLNKEKPPRSDDPEEGTRLYDNNTRYTQ